MYNFLNISLVITVILAVTVISLPLNVTSQQSKNINDDNDDAALDSDDRKRCPSVDWNGNHKSGSIYSPGYPSKYPNNSNCTYILLGETGKRVKIIFEEFDLEPCCDYLYLYDGIISEASKIKKLSGKHKKGTTFETKLSNILIVKFTSDANFRFKGFKATFDSV
uniref:CUB domain-containing protein n=1 Tax=Panagrolaimus superbus TaxID=310955 RepID=A0A914YF30_9BILA